MILAAGRGERMRPLSDTTPKPLLEAGGKPLIVWQIEALARAGFRDIVVNVSHLADRVVAALGRRRRARCHAALVDRSRASGGGGRHRHSAAAPAARTGIDRLRRHLSRRSTTLRSDTGRRRWHARNPLPAPISCWYRIPPITPAAISRSPTASSRSSGARATRTRTSASTIRTLFRELPRGAKLKLLPYLQRWIADGRVSGETFDGAWANVGTPRRSRRARCCIAAIRRSAAHNHKLDK